MSLLDTIKSLFCKKSCDKTESKQDEKVPEVVEKKADSAPEVKSEPVVEVEPEKKADPAPEVKPEPVAKAKPKKKAKPVAKKKAKPAPAAKSAQLQVPEDSALKRHFLSTLKAEVESGMPPRPTDATLIRHYDALVQDEMKKLLS